MATTAPRKAVTPTARWRDELYPAGRDLGRVLRVRWGAAGGAARPAGGDGADGPLEGVHRAEGLGLPAGAVDAAGDGHGRVLRGGDAVVASDLDLGLPHSRGRFDG